MIPMADFYPKFWRHVQSATEERAGEEVGLAILRYCVYLASYFLALSDANLLQPSCRTHHSQLNSASLSQLSTISFPLV